MAAQFDDEKVPDKYCEGFKFAMGNGTYKVDIIQYFDIDGNSYVGDENFDVLFVFTKTEYIDKIEPKVYWYTY